MWPKGSSAKPGFKSLIDASIIGIQLVLCTFAGFAVGYVLDKKVFNSFPWLTIIFLILGIIAGFRELFRIAGRQDGPDKKGN